MEATNTSFLERIEMLGGLSKESLPHLSHFFCLNLLASFEILK